MSARSWRYGRPKIAVLKIFSLVVRVLERISLYSYSTTATSGPGNIIVNLADGSIGIVDWETAGLPFAGAPTSSSPRSVEAPPDEIQTRERSETTGSRPEVQRDTSRRGTPAQDLEWWEKRETRAVVETLGRRELGVEEVVGEAGGVEMQLHEEPVGQKEELRPPALGDQQNLAEVDNTDEEQVKSPFASAPTSPSPRSVEAPQDQIQSRERSETTGSRPEELRDAS